jgi:hypothetical protein
MSAPPLWGSAVHELAVYLVADGDAIPLQLWQ